MFFPIMVLTKIIVLLIIMPWDLLDNGQYRFLWIEDIKFWYYIEICCIYMCAWGQKLVLHILLTGTFEMSSDAWVNFLQCNCMWDISGQWRSKSIKYYRSQWNVLEILYLPSPVSLWTSYGQQLCLIYFCLPSILPQFLTHSCMYIAWTVPTGVCSRRMSSC